MMAALEPLPASQDAAMTPDLWILLAVAGLQWVLILTAAIPRLVTHGMPWSVSARDQTPTGEVPQWALRAQKASDNLAENLVLFAIVILVVHVAGAANDTSALGAGIFLGARILHPILYIAGLSWLRSVVWGIGVAGVFVSASVLM